jgi:hypothetical protein
MRLGLSRYEAIRAVEDAVDWQAVQALPKSGCTVAVALEVESLDEINFAVVEASGSMSFLKK